jgi:hypothetical protein
MFSVTLATWSGTLNFTGIGVANHSLDLGNYTGSDTNSVGFYDNGEVWGEGSLISSSVPSFQTAGAVLDVAVDRINDKVYLRVNGGNWNNDPTADPSTATGGIDISYIAGTVYPAISPWRSASAADQLVINTQAQYAVPQGFQFVNGLTDHSNDVLLRVNTVSNTGTILDAFYAGIAPVLTVGQTFIDVVGTNISGSGTGATWDFEVVGEDTTTFDQGSMRFIAPVDMYSQTTVYDKYLKFPYRTILG